MPFFFVCHSELILHVFAGAEVLDEQIQKDNDGIHEDDQERRVNAGGSPFAFSAKELICTVTSFHLGVTSRITAEIAVMDRIKAVTSPEKKESLMRAGLR